MKMLFSASVVGFYSSVVNYGDSLPVDAVEISAEDYAIYSAPAPTGKKLSAVSGLPSWVDQEVIPLTIDEQIAVLEATVTKRWLRGAALGDTYAIAQIQAVEDEIALLRA